MYDNIFSALLLIIIASFLYKVYRLISPSKTRSKNTGTNEPENCNLVGKSNFELGQIATNKDSSGQKKEPVNHDVIFAPETIDTSSLTKIDADFQIEYSDDEIISEHEVENEEIYLQNDSTESAQGFTYDELVEVLQVVGKNDAGDEEKSRTANTLSNISDNLLKTMYDALGLNEQKVARLFQELNEKEYPGAQSEVINDINRFDINDFIEV